MQISTLETASVSITSTGRVFTYDRFGRARELAGVIEAITVVIDAAK